jgi:DNA-binding NarL/FixJ family response regulator
LKNNVKLFFLREDELIMIELVKDNEVVSVVIVEDYKLTRVGLKSTLNEYEHINVVGEAEDATSGISLIESLKPDVVLMDLGLPGMNGLEATMKIKEKGLKSKVIILTYHERGEEVIAA